MVTGKRRNFHKLAGGIFLTALVGCGSLKPMSPSGKPVAQKNSENGSSANSDSSTTTPADCKAPSSGGASAVSFAADIKPILDGKCVACHQSIAPAMSTVDEATTNAQLILDSVTAGRMPKSAKLPDAEIAKIQEWVTAGMPKLALAANDPTWYADIQPLISGKCAYCHNGKSGSPGPTLLTYTQVSNSANSVSSSMSGGGDRMPPSNATPQLATGDTQMFTAWINAGKPMGTPPVAIDPTKPVYYNDAIKSLLAANCTTCHKAGGQSPDLSTYAAAKAAGALSLADIKGKTMPKAAPLSANDIAGFQKWADLGYPLDANSVPAPAPAPAPIDPAKGAYYNDNIKNLLAQECTACHGAGGQSPDLSTYDAAKKAGALSLSDIQAGTMPKSGKLKADYINLFKAWADAGYPLDSTSKPAPAGGSTPPAGGGTTTDAPPADPCAGK